VYLQSWFQNSIAARYLVIGFVALLAIFIQQFPNFNAYLKTPLGMHFSGQATWFDPWDINVYVATIRSGQAGKIFVQNQYTTEHRADSLIYPIYTITGKLFPQANPFVLFHTLAALGAVLLSFSLYFFAYFLTRDQGKSLMVLPLSLFGGGMGWLVQSFHRSADISVTSITFVSSLQRSHEAVGTILYLGSMVALFATKDSKSIYRFIIPSILLTALVFFYPYYLLSFACIGLTFGLWRKYHDHGWRMIINVIVSLVIPSLITLAYYHHIQTTDFASAASESLKNIGFWSLIFGYSLFVLTIPLLLRLKKNSYNKQLVAYLCIWIIVSVALAYRPFGFSRFFLRGMFFPLVTLFVTLLFAIKADHIRKLVLLSFIPLFFLTQGYIFNRRVSEPQNTNKWFYLSGDKWQGFEYLKTSPGEGILSLYTMGNYLPAMTGKTVYLGHLIQTPDAKEKLKQIRSFYSGKMSDQEACDFLKEANINEVVYSEEELEFGGQYYSCMEKTYDSPTFVVFRVKNSPDL